VKHRNF